MPESGRALVQEGRAREGHGEMTGERLKVRERNMWKGGGHGTVTSFGSSPTSSESSRNQGPEQEETSGGSVRLMKPGVEK